jgi:hypothetical protein
MEKTMRVIAMALAGIIGGALLTPSAEAVPAPGQSPVGIQNILPVANGCGAGWHWVPGFRRPDGWWVPGRCVRNYY